MAALSTDQLLDAIGSMNLMEISDLVKAMEERFGVVAAAPVAVAGAAPAGGAPGVAAEPEAEPTEFNAVLTEVGPNKINVIKGVRELVPSLGLKEAKDLVDSAPKPIKENVTKDEAEAVKAKLAEVGATVNVVPVG
ncbi:MAG: ribosomal protein [Chloroflexi bacterium]|jgi:large subunit ribosomal protein L7/L12|nr:ribosomal protein [Chloroflexota bacterium]